PPAWRPARTRCARLSFIAIPQPQSSALFPYTTLFRSLRGRQDRFLGGGARGIRESARPEPVDWGEHAGRDRRPLGALRHRPLGRSEEHTSELQSQSNLVCRLLLEKKNNPLTRTPASQS